MGFVADIFRGEGQADAAQQAAQAQTGAIGQAITAQNDALEGQRQLFNTQLGKAGQATQEQRDVRAGIPGLFDPLRQAGTTNLQRFADLSTDQNTQKSELLSGPFYKALADDAQQRIFNNSAARGKVGSGGTPKALQNALLLLGDDLTNSNVARRANLAQFGANATNAQQGFRQQATDNISNLLNTEGSINKGFGNVLQANADKRGDLLIDQGNSEAAGIVGAGNAVAGGQQNTLDTLSGAAQLLPDGTPSNVVGDIATGIGGAAGGIASLAGGAANAAKNFLGGTATTGTVTGAVDAAASAVPAVTSAVASPASTAGAASITPLPATATGTLPATAPPSITSPGVATSAQSVDASPIANAPPNPSGIADLASAAATGVKTIPGLLQGTGISASDLSLPVADAATSGGGIAGLSSLAAPAAIGLLAASQFAGKKAARKKKHAMWDGIRKHVREKAPRDANGNPNLVINGQILRIAENGKSPWGFGTFRLDTGEILVFGKSPTDFKVISSEEADLTFGKQKLDAVAAAEKLPARVIENAGLNPNNLHAASPGQLQTLVKQSDPNIAIDPQAKENIASTNTQFRGAENLPRWFLRQNGIQDVSKLSGLSPGQLDILVRNFTGSDGG